MFRIRQRAVELQQGKKQGAGDRSVFRILDTALKLVHRVQNGDEFLTCKFPSGGIGRPDSRGQTLLKKFLQRLFILEKTENLAPLLDPEQRRLGNEQMSPLDEIRIMAEEKGQHQCTDMRAVHVRVGHDDDLVVAELRDIEILVDSRSKRRYHGFDLRVSVNTVESRLLHV